ncbi:MAG: hypothetical protein ACFFBD_03705 [Candidatus Hodarchaeota archaeon]
MSEFEEWASKLLEQGYEQKIDLTQPYAYYGFNRDPFDRNLAVNEKSAFQTPPWGELIVQIGSALRNMVEAKGNISWHLLVVGPSGCGKTTFAKRLSHLKDPTSEDDLAFYLDAAQWVDSINHSSIRGGSEEPESPESQYIRAVLTYDTWLGNLSRESALLTRLKTAKVLFVDNISLLCGKNPQLPLLESFQHDLESFTGTKHLIVGFIRKNEWIYLKNNYMDTSIQSFLGSFHPEKIFLSPFSKKELVELLERRLKTSSKEDKEDLLPFTQETLIAIAENSLGVPAIAIKLAEDVLRYWVSAAKREEIQREDIEEFVHAQQIPLAKKMLRKQMDLSSKRLDILLEVLSSNAESKIVGKEAPGITNKAIAQKFGVRMSAISYHLKHLAEEHPILIRRTDPNDARSQLYYTKGIFIVALEYLFLDEREKMPDLGDKNIEQQA